MALTFKTMRVKFDSTKGKIQDEPGSVNFGKKVRTAHAAINGFHIEYTEKERPFWKQTVEIHDLVINDESVNFRARLQLRDSSGNLDDRYGGWIDVLVIADLV